LKIETGDRYAFRNHEEDRREQNRNEEHKNTQTRETSLRSDHVAPIEVFTMARDGCSR